MLCDVCKKNTATVFLTQIVDGKMQKVNLCESCSKEKGVTDPTSFAFLDLLQGLGTAQVIAKTQPSLRCPTCGFSLGDFKKTGRLGCSRCFETFSENVASLLKTVHRGTRHLGKIPNRSAQIRDVSRRIEVLQEDLRKAVDAENYESAAAIRDIIRQLQSSASQN